MGSFFLFFFFFNALVLYQHVCHLEFLRDGLQVNEYPRS